MKKMDAFLNRNAEIKSLLYAHCISEVFSHSLALK